MLLPLDKTHRIRYSQHNYLLEGIREFKGSDGKGNLTGETREDWDTIGYYSSAKGAMQAYINKGFDTCNTYQELIDRLELLEALVKEHL